MKLEVTEVCLLKDKRTTDLLIIKTTLPNKIWPFKGFQQFKTEIAQGEGEKYIKEHFKCCKVTIKDISI